MRDAGKACVCEMCARNRLHGNYFAVVGWLMYSCLYISFSFCFCLENVRCYSTVLLFHFQSKTLFAFLLFQHSVPNFGSVQKSTSGSDQSILQLLICNLPLAVNEEPEVADGKWQFDIKQQFCWNDFKPQLRLLTTLFHPLNFVGIIIVTA